MCSSRALKGRLKSSTGNLSGSATHHGRLVCVPLLCNTVRHWKLPQLRSPPDGGIRGRLFTLFHHEGGRQSETTGERPLGVFLNSVCGTLVLVESKTNPFCTSRSMTYTRFWKDFRTTNCRRCGKSTAICLWCVERPSANISGVGLTCDVTRVSLLLSHISVRSRRPVRATQGIQDRETVRLHSAKNVQLVSAPLFMILSPFHIE